MGAVSSRTDEQGDLSRRWAELGLVRASQLRGRSGGAAGAGAPRRGPRPAGLHTPTPADVGAEGPGADGLGGGGAVLAGRALGTVGTVRRQPPPPDLEAAEALPV